MSYDRCYGRVSEPTIRFPGVRHPFCCRRDASPTKHRKLSHGIEASQELDKERAKR